MHVAAQEPNTDCFQTLSGNQTVLPACDDLQKSDATYPSVVTACPGMQQPVTKQDDDSSCYVIIGTTAIALAAVAASVVRHREQIHECIANAIPALSKSVAAAKSAIFHT